MKRILIQGKAAIWNCPLHPKFPTHLTKTKPTLPHFTHLPPYLLPKEIGP